MCDPCWNWCDGVIPVDGGLELAFPGAASRWVHASSVAELDPPFCHRCDGVIPFRPGTAAPTDNSAPQAMVCAPPGHHHRDRDRWTRVLQLADLVGVPATSLARCIEGLRLSPTSPTWTWRRIAKWGLSLLVTGIFPRVVASGVSAPMMHRPLCGCRCGCRRRPGRLVLCVRCGARIGPGCCLALESRTRWGRGLCHVCDDGEPEHVIGVCVAEHTTTPVLGPEVAQMVSTTALAAAAPAAQSMGEQSMAQGLNADIVARSIERSNETAVLAAQTAVPVPVSAPSPTPSWTTAWTMPSWVIFGFELFVNSRRGVVPTP